MKNMCYGIIIDNIYLSIVESVITYKNTIELSYNIRPEPTWSKYELMNLINEINDYYKNSIIFTYQLIQNNYSIGYESSDNLWYFHKKENIDRNFLKNKEFLYNPIDIDNAILQRNIVTDLSTKGVIKKFQNNLYKLFVSEFIEIMQNKTNATMRTEIKKIMKKLNLSDSKSIYTTNSELSKLLTEYPMDLFIIQNFIEFIYFNSISIKNILAFIDESRSEFDYQLITELRNIKDKEKMIYTLKELMKDSITIGEIIDIPNYYNIYTNCKNNGKQFFCNNNKLIVPSSRYDDLFDVLVDDIMNKSKTYILMSSISGIFDYLDFIPRPHEFIEIIEIKDM